VDKLRARVEEQLGQALNLPSQLAGAVKELQDSGEIAAIENETSKVVKKVSRSKKRKTSKTKTT
jgi:hypothetical protein